MGFMAMPRKSELRMPRLVCENPDHRGIILYLGDVELGVLIGPHFSN